MILGIDPGITGALALVGGDAVEFFDTPTIWTEVGKKKKRIYDEAQMAYIVDSVRARFPGVRAIIESVHAFPGQGVTSMFTFGMGYGIWLGILAALKIPSRRVTPQRWKKEVLQDGPKTDQATVAFAGRLYPEVAAQLRGPRGALDLGRADALLIAHWGRGDQGRIAG